MARETTRIRCQPWACLETPPSPSSLTGCSTTRPVSTEEPHLPRSGKKMCMYVCLYVCIFVYMCVCLFVCMCVSVCEIGKKCRQPEVATKPKIRSLRPFFCCQGIFWLPPPLPKEMLQKKNQVLSGHLPVHTRSYMYLMQLSKTTSKARASIKQIHTFDK